MAIEHRARFLETNIEVRGDTRGINATTGEIVKIKAAGFAEGLTFFGERGIQSESESESEESAGGSECGQASCRNCQYRMWGRKKGKN